MSTLRALAAGAALACVLSGSARAQAPLGTDELMASVERAFPLVDAARREQEAAAGVALDARGGFDLKLKAGAETVQGYYDNERVKAGVEQPLAPLGMTLFGGYRVGRGTFPTYDEKALTLGDGEVSAGLNLPLLRDRATDQRRAALRVSALGVDVADQTVAKARLSAFKDALKVYWEWVASGRQLAVVRGLLDLAEQRDRDLETAVSLGQIAPVERVDNRRAILQRRSALVTAGRAVEAAAIGLSLYYRGIDGAPVRLSADRLPAALPEPETLSSEDEAAAIDAALVRRPEVQSLRLKRQQQDVETNLAGNALLPSLNLFADLSRDYGTGRVSRTGTELAGGISFEMPLQRRKAAGKLAQARAKLGVLDAELRLAQDRVRAEVQDAASALRAAYASVDLARQEVAVARELESLERDRFQLGDSTQFLVNLRELNTADAAVREIKALAEYQKARAEFDAASGRLLGATLAP